MATYATSTSSITWNAVAINGLFEISWNYSRTPIEVTELGNAFKNYIYGQSEVSGTVQAYMDGDAAQQSIVVADAIAGTKRALVFTAHTGEAYTVSDCMIESFDVSSALNDVVKITFNFRGCAAMTET
jgi:hypothetical protein